MHMRIRNCMHQSIWNRWATDDNSAFVTTIDVLRFANKEQCTTVRASFRWKTAIERSYRLTAESSPNVHILAIGGPHVAALTANSMVTTANSAFAPHGWQMATSALRAVHVDRANASHARAGRMMQSTNAALRRCDGAHGASHYSRVPITAGIAPTLPFWIMPAMALCASGPAWRWC